MATQLIDQTAWMPAGAGDPLAPGGPLADFVARARLVPTFARSYHYHGMPVDGPPDPGLLRTLRPLQGKFTVVNPALRAPLPLAARRRVERLVRAAHARAGAAVAVGGVTAGGVALALAEPVHPVVRHEGFVADAPAEGGRDIRFSGSLLYRLIVALDAGDGADLAAAPVRRRSRPIPWFDIAILTPDAEAMRLMEVSTRHYYRHVTGRLGAASRDSYWFADTWERYHEPGRVIGCIHPDVVDHTTPGHAPSAHPPADAPSPEEAFLYAPSAGERSSWGDYSPRADRRFFPPPGYCLIRYGCWLEIALVSAARREEAA